MLIKSEVVERIRTGEITVLFRRWSRPQIKAGGTQMTQGGIVGIEAVDVVEAGEITDADARQTGLASAAELLELLSYRDDPIYRIRVNWQGEDPRVALREDVDLGDEEVREVIDKLEKLDKNSKREPWTKQYLQLIHDHPATYSGRLAGKLGIKIPQFKPRVRKLKALGLTESLEVGYRLSPRGERILEELNKNDLP